MLNHVMLCEAQTMFYRLYVKQHFGSLLRGVTCHLTWHCICNCAAKDNVHTQRDRDKLRHQKLNGMYKLVEVCTLTDFCSDNGNVWIWC